MGVVGVNGDISPPDMVSDRVAAAIASDFGSRFSPEPGHRGASWVKRLRVASAPVRSDSSQLLLMVRACCSHLPHHFNRGAFLVRPSCEAARRKQEVDHEITTLGDNRHVVGVGLRTARGFGRGTGRTSNERPGCCHQRPVQDVRPALSPPTPTRSNMRVARLTWMPSATGM